MKKNMVPKKKFLNNNEFSFGPWTIRTVKGPIMNSEEIERVTNELDIPQLPEMVFGDNKMEIQHQDGFGITFNATDALKKVNNKQDLMKVAVAEEWQRLRAETDGIKEVIKPFDWTYTTDYKGTLLSNESASIKAIETKDRIDLDKLKVKEKIYFYEEMILYEDELADNGMAQLVVKIRVMAGSFFLLQRFFLRVDNVLVRINDTRLFHEVGSDFMLREYSTKEKAVSKLQKPYADPSELAEKLDLKSEVFEKLEFITQSKTPEQNRTDDGQEI